MAKRAPTNKRVKNETKDGLHRFRFIFPNEDKDVFDWVTTQTDLNYALTAAVRLMIKTYGKRDFKRIAMDYATKMLHDGDIPGGENSKPLTNGQGLSATQARPAPAAKPVHVPAQPMPVVPAPTVTPGMFDFGAAGSLTETLPGSNPQPKYESAAGKQLK